MTPGKNRRRTIFGAVDLASGRFLYQVTRKAISVSFTAQGRVRQVHAFFRGRTTAQMLATAAPHSSPWLPEGYVPNFREPA